MISQTFFVEIKGIAGIFLVRVLDRLKWSYEGKLESMSYTECQIKMEKYQNASYNITISSRDWIFLIEHSITLFPTVGYALNATRERWRSIRALTLQLCDIVVQVRDIRVIRKEM